MLIIRIRIVIMIIIVIVIRMIITIIIAMIIMIIMESRPSRVRAWRGPERFGDLPSSGGMYVYIT